MDAEKARELAAQCDEVSKTTTDPKVRELMLKHS